MWQWRRASKRHLVAVVDKVVIPIMRQRVCVRDRGKTNRKQKCETKRSEMIDFKISLESSYCFLVACCLATTVSK